MSAEPREQGQTRQQILVLLRRSQSMTASELGDELGIGAVGIRQHLALLQRDNLVQVVGLRRSIGRPSHLYALTELADTIFPQSYDSLAIDALAYVQETGGQEAVSTLFQRRRERMTQTLQSQFQDPLPQRLQTLMNVLDEQGYMTELVSEANGQYTLFHHNCPIAAVARQFPQACLQEKQLYESLLGIPLTSECTIANGASCCCYRTEMAVSYPSPSEAES